ncbi:MAG: efflux RND transporter permease subunit, partial [Bacteroidota bacterium]
LLKPLATRFQKNSLVNLENWYERRLTHALRGRNVYWYFGVTMLLLFAAFATFGGSVGSQRTKVEFFPDNTPKEIYVYIEYPQGTDINKTNSLTKTIEERVYEIIKDEKYFRADGENLLVDTGVSQVGRGAENPFTEGGSSAEMPHRGKITLSMQEFKFRDGLDTEALRLRIQNSLAEVYPGVIISVEKDAVGPPAGYPVNIELVGKNYDTLISVAERMKNFINTKSIDGMEGLKVDVNKGSPGMQVTVDRQKAGELGVSVGQVGQQLRRSIFGNKAGVYKKDGEDYDINVRFNENLRYNTSALFNQNIIFRDQATGQIKEIPISAVGSRKNTSSFNAIKHINGDRVVTVYSGLKPGGNANIIVDQIKKEMENFKGMPSGVKVDYTGELEEQAKQQAFLMGAFFAGLGLIMLILVFQFGGISKPGIIMMAIFLSFIGVFGGL